MAHSMAARLGGILFVVLYFRSSYLTPPDAPVLSSSPQDVVGPPRRDPALQRAAAHLRRLRLSVVLRGAPRRAAQRRGRRRAYLDHGAGRGAGVHNTGSGGGGGRDPPPAATHALRELRARRPTWLPLP